MTGHILVPLPEDINPCVRYPVYTQGGPGQRGVCLHNVYATTRSDRLLEHLRETILDADQPLILGEEVTHTIVERAFFPGESRGRAGRSIKERNDTGRWTLADILMRIILKQREWYWKDVRSAEVQSLIGGSNSPVWNWWAQRGMHEDLVWIVAVRQTLPDHQGQTRWIPELELRDR
ncbi:hypothetical protein L226DRAFT_305574 [Lentinus tigrinus ALCF2SS1-7]|nr:hypothetical protein L226DRAFT_305574 [Lentinus tigrinus ALCF2SS1-7]